MRLGLTSAFEFSVPTLTVPGFKPQKNFKILLAFNQQHHSAPPYLLSLG